MNLVIFVFFSGKIHLQLASEDPLKSQTAYLTPFSIPKNQWIHLVVSYSDHIVCSKKLHSELSSFKACSHLLSAFASPSKFNIVSTAIQILT